MRREEFQKINMETFHINYENLPFVETSKTAAEPNRLNWRCEILLTRNRYAIKDKKILDLASHDGRFSYACLKLGANYVAGVEARPHLVKYAKENLINLGCEQKHFTFIEDDIFNYLPKVKSGEFDTIICLGFFHHTIRQIELLREIIRIKPKYFILDTPIEKELVKKKSRNRYILLRLLKSIVNIGHLMRTNSIDKRLKKIASAPKRDKGFLSFRRESHEVEGLTIDRIDLVAVPTRSFIEMFFKQLGFNFKELYWDKREIKNWDQIDDYKKGRRVSYIAQLY